MLETIIVVLVILWLLGAFGWCGSSRRGRWGGGNLIHVLLVIVVILLLTDSCRPLYKKKEAA